MAKIILLSSHAESLLTFRREMLKSLALHNHVIACAPNASNEVIAQLNNIRVEYRHVPLNRTGLNPFSDLSALRALYRTFKQIRPDQVFSYTSKPVIFGSIAAKCAGVKHIYSMITGLGSYFVHQDPKSRLVRSIMGVLYKIALSFNTKVFFQNPDDRDDFARLKIFSDANRTVMINGSGVNVDHFTPSVLPQQTVFLLITRFIKAKGLIEYLSAARELKAKYATCKFLLVGWFENKDEAIGMNVLQPYIDQNIVEYLGKLEDVRPAIAQASVFVLPSYREGTPKSVLEAMACGRAIITTNVPGCRETVVDGDNGLLIAARNVEQLVQAMEKFILNPSLATQMGNRSREIAVQKFDVKKVNQQIFTAMGYNYV